MRLRPYGWADDEDDEPQDRVLGFSGTRAGMTLRQQKALTTFVEIHRPAVGRHGDCKGADEQFHEILKSLVIPLIIHPPVKNTWRAFCEGAQEVLPPKEYLARNDDILHQSDFIIAAPREYEMQRRGSGTWAMIRHAIAEDAEVYVVFPFGEVMRPTMDAWGRLSAKS
jgi:hypothetical protein